jgi:glutamate/tyrosine decarboxylase-like PLP-dependent enzyme
MARRQSEGKSASPGPIPVTKRFGFPESPPDPEVLARFDEALRDNVNNYGMHCRPGHGQADPYGEMERDLVADAAAFVGMPADDTLGYVAPGATEAALFTAWAARRLGIQRALVSRRAHSSVEKALALAGLGHDAIRVEAPMTAEEVARALARVPPEEPLWATVTWVNPVFAETDSVAEVVRLLKRRPGLTLVHVDGAVGGLLGPLIRGETLEELSVDVLGMDFHKVGQAPVGTGLVLYREWLHGHVAMPQAYLPTGEEVTPVGSRNAAFAAAAAGSLKLARDGRLAARYEALEPLAATLDQRLGHRQAARLFPYSLYDLGRTPIGAELEEALAAFAIHPMACDGRALARICLSPGQGGDTLEQLTDLIAGI